MPRNYFIKLIKTLFLNQIKRDRLLYFPFPRAHRQQWQPVASYYLLVITQTQYIRYKQSDAFAAMPHEFTIAVVKT